MSSSRKLPQSSTAVDVGCSCGRPKKLSHLFLFPKLSKPKNHNLPHKPDPYPSTSASASASSSDPGKSTMSFDTTPFLSESSEEAEKIFIDTKMNSRIGDSVAVVKDSSDPYLDFRQSMLQMILEKEIYSKAELRELLDCFLALNSPCHHHVIVRAFAEIWDGVFSLGQGFPSRVRRRSRDY